MANKQLVQYIKEQLSHKMSIDAIRTVLHNQGWMENDIQEAIQVATQRKHKQNIKEHHSHFLAVSALSVIAILLAGGLFISVFNDQPTVPVPDQIPPKPIHIPAELSGVDICFDKIDSAQKDLCYQEINQQDEEFDCASISEDAERSYCFRAKEFVLLSKYNNQA